MQEIVCDEFGRYWRFYDGRPAAGPYDTEEEAEIEDALE